MFDRDIAVLRGTVLRAWRIYRETSLTQLAAALNRTPAALSMLETGRRGTRMSTAPLGARDFARLRACLRLTTDEAASFRDIWRSAGSVVILPSRMFWAHNYQPPSQLSWVWLRPAIGAAHIRAALWWGEPLQGTLDMDVPAGGLFLQVPTTIPNPPLEVRFTPPGGWADFGRGLVPAAVAAHLDALVVDGRQFMRAVQPSGPPLVGPARRALAPMIGLLRGAAETFEVQWALIAPHLGMARAHRTLHVFEASAEAASALPADISTDDLGHVVSQLQATPTQLQRIREGRGMSRDEVEAAATALDPFEPLTARAVRSIETKGALPSSARSIPRLDLLYGLDGHLGVERTFVSTARRGSVAVTFPPYWHGPIWVQVTAPSDDSDGMIELTWGPWRRSQWIRAGTVVTTRAATPESPPLHVRAPNGWTVVAGTGVIATATDVGHGWSPRSLRAAAGLLVENVRAALVARRAPLGRSVADEERPPPDPIAANIREQ